MHQLRSFTAVVALAMTTAALAQKKPLDANSYDGWKSIQGTSLSRDGKWLLYRVVPQEGDGVLMVQPTAGGKATSIERGSTSLFSYDSHFVVTTVVPKLEDTKKARRDKVKPEDQPKAELRILNLTSGETVTIPKVSTFTMADKGGHFLVYKPEPPKAEPPKPAAKPDEKKAEEKKSEEKKEDKPAKKAEHKAGDPLVIRDLISGAETKLEDVSGYRLSEDGKTLAYSLSTKDGKGDGVCWMDLETKKTTTLIQALGRYSKLTFDKSGHRLAFLTDKDDYSAKKPGSAVYVVDSGKAPKLVAKFETGGLPKGWWVNENSVVRFSESGKRLFFSIAPKPAEEPEDKTPDDEKVAVDIWNWQDATLQPQQLLRANFERNRTYECFQDLSSGKITVLETPEMSNVSVSDRGDGRFALGTNAKPYEILASWDTGYADVTAIDLQTGKQTLLLKKTSSGVGLSPTGKYIAGYDEVAKKFLIYPTDSLKGHEVTGIPYPIWDEDNDVPSPASSYGLAGWTKDDDRVLLYDRFDIWSVDPTGAKAPVCITNGVGRLRDTTYRYVRTDPEATYIDTTKPLLLSTFNEDNKHGGFAWDGVAASEAPKTIVSGPKKYSNPMKADDAETVCFTQMDFVEYPDLWVADNLSLENARKVSDANPQQKDYNWGTAELVSWTSNDGTPLQGILIKPENFDYGKKYPMITYFYERNSETLYSYRTPSPTASILNPTVAASNGYIVFIPDIVYKEGYPGESAISCIMPGVQSILARGYVDPKRLAIDGQSWGGYQVAYMITETNMFRCAYAGAPVSNMTSAYGGIRWGSGLVREFQYERTQSRIGYSLWEKPLRFLENSPVFFLDKVQTPVLIMANDKDGAVPWYQGIEMFTGLRRLQRPSWLLVYNDEDHNLVQRKNRKDLSIRKQQFYDYYLKDAPMPEWMKTGIPAVDKGKNMGFKTGN